MSLIFLEKYNHVFNFFYALFFKRKIEVGLRFFANMTNNCDVYR